MASLQTLTEISRLYVALFGRAPDGQGLAFWVAQRESGASLATLANTMYATTPARQHFPAGLAPSDLVQAFYVNVLGRQPDFDGWNFWTARLAATGSTGALIQEMISVVAEYTGSNAAGLTSAAFFNNRTAVAQYYAQKNGALNGAADAIRNVNQSTLVQDAFAAIDRGQAPGAGGSGGNVPSPAPAPAPGGGAPPPPPPPAPATANFTTGVDALAGAATPEVFAGLWAAAGATFQAGDTLNGGDGADTLDLASTHATANNLPAVATSSVEGINVRNTGGAQTVNASNFSGAARFNNDRSTSALTFNNLASGTAVEITGNGAVTLAASTFNFASSAPSAALTVTGGTLGTGAVTLTGTGLSSVTLDSTGAANSMGALTLPAGVTQLTINAATNLTIGAIAGFTNTTSRLTVSGAAASVTLGAGMDVDLAVLDASGLAAGGITITLANDTDLAVTGGGGADVITTGAALANGTVDAAAGVDRLVAGSSAHLNSATLGARYTGFEILQVGDGVSVDLGNIPSIATLYINDGSGVTGPIVSNLSADQAARIQVVAGNATGAFSIGVSNATVPGQADVVKVTVDDNLAATNTIALGTPTLAGIETLELTAVDHVTVAGLTGAGSNLSKVTLGGSGNFTVATGAMTGANIVIDGSAATGVLAITAGTGMRLVGGSGNDTLNGSTAIDVLQGGAGDDLLLGNAGADFLTGGSGANIFRFLSLAANGAPSATNFDTVTDWRTGSNAIDFASANLSITSGGSGASGQAAISAAGIATFNAADATVAARITAVAAAMAATGGAALGEVAIWQQGADAYIFISDATAAVGATDVLIQLAGVTVGAGGLTLAGGDLTAVA